MHDVFYRAATFFYCKKILLMGLYVAVDEITNSEMVPEFMAFKTNELLIHIGKYDNKQKAKNL